MKKRLSVFILVALVFLMPFALAAPSDKVQIKRITSVPHVIKLQQLQVVKNVIRKLRKKDLIIYKRQAGR